MLTLNPLLRATDVPPIPAAQVWADRYDGGMGSLINLAQAVPGTPPPDMLLERLGAAAVTARAATYGSIYGDAELRSALARDASALYGGTIDAEEIAITAGCNQAFFVAMLALASAGDEVILPSPWYFNHKMSLDMLGIRVVPLPCHAETGFVPDVEAARRLVSARTRAIVLVTPNNPTGATYPAPVIAAFRDLCEEAGLALVLDETYRDFLPEGIERPHDLFETGAWRGRMVQLYSFSKSYAVPGHRIGSIIADGATREEIGKVLDCVQICPPRAAQTALAWAVEGIRGWRAETRQAINRRIAVFRDVVGRSRGWRISAIGAYFAYVRHPLGTDAMVAAERLAAEAGVVTLPGSFFGDSEGRHIRFAFANVPDDVLPAVTRRLDAIG